MTAVSSARTSAIPHRHRLFYALAAVFAIDGLTSLVVLAYGNAYLLRELNAAPSAPAIALTIYGVVKLVSAPFAGHIVDRLPTRPMLVAIGAIDVGALLVILATRSEMGYFLGVGGLALAIATTWIIAFRALGAAAHETQRGTAAALMSVIAAGATAAGFGFAAVVAEAGPWWPPFVVGIVLAIASMVLLYISAPEEPGVAEAEIEAARLLTPPLANARPSARLAVAAVVFGHFALISGLLVAFWPFTLALLGLSPVRAALTLVPSGIASVVVLVGSGRRSRRGRRLQQASFMYGIGAVGLLVTATATERWELPAVFWFALGTVLVAPALAGAQPLLTASMIDVSRMGTRGGASLGWLFSAEGLGSIAGPALVGFAIEVWDVRAGVLVIALMTAVVAVVAPLAARVARL